MNFDTINAENDPEKVKALARELLARNLALEGELQVMLREITRLTGELAAATDKDRQLALHFEIKRLNEKIADKNREIFGPSRSERRARPATEPQPEKPKKEKPRGHGPTKQDRLPLHEVEHKLDPADQICPKCGDPLPEMAGQTEDAEQITIVERRVVRTLHKRQKYRCCGCGCIDTAIGPAPLVPGGRYSPEFGVGVAVDKYSDHLPLDRQVHRFDRLGLDVSSQTLWDQLARMYQLLLPSYLALHAFILAKDLVGVDETTWRVMGKGKSQKWWMWALTTENAVFYMLVASRGTSAAIELFKNFSGIAMADAYAVYRSLERMKDRIANDPQATLLDLDQSRISNFTLVNCWSHVRRGFFQAEKNDPAATTPLDLIDRLYAIEAQAKTEAGGDPAKLLDARRRLRNALSRPVIAELRAWLDAVQPVPGLKLEEAVGYLRNQWAWLVRFLEDPRIPLDNNASERSMRGPVLGRKNHYGSRSEEGTRVAALFYSLIETCKLVGIDPAAYLLEAVRRAMAAPGTVTLPHDLARERAAAPAAS